MKSFFLCLLFVTAIANAAESFKITFNVYAPGLPDSATVYISGNDCAIGGWHPGTVALLKTKTDLWQLQTTIPDSTLLEFKFTRGSWANEALDANGKIPANHLLHVFSDTSFTVLITQWNSGEIEAEFVGQVTGTVNLHTDFRFGTLRPRDVQVWLPPGYQANSGQRFPVLYMHDGQNLFDPQTSFSGVDWQLDEIADSLITGKHIRPVIIVGINNTDDRSREYAPGDTGSAYMQLVTTVIKPFIDREYPTLPDRKNTFTGGGSSGALISFMLIWEHPDVFSGAACLSTPFRIAHLDYVRTVRNTTDVPKDIRVYLDNGDVGLEERLQPGNDEVMSELEKKGYRSGIDFTWYLDKGAEHGEEAWARRGHRFIRWLLSESK
jgi:enterochelin esterase-like enzyme